MIGRRGAIAGGLALALIGPGALASSAAPGMHGLIGKMRAKPGQRPALLAILIDDLGGMPGCLSYVVAEDPVEAELIWVTEVWDREESHAASLQLPAVRAAIARALPLIAGMEAVATTRVVGGIGLG